MPPHNPGDKPLPRSSTRTRCTRSPRAWPSARAGNVAVSACSSVAIGRLVPHDVVGLARYLREHTAPATA
jgi:hypothetical protein